MSASTLAAWHSMDNGGVAPMSPDTTRDAERDLIARSRNGDLEAFGRIYANHEQAVYRHAYRLLEDPDEADDVRQETFVRAYQTLARFRGDAAFRTYLLSICGNLCRDRHRTRLRRPERRYGLDAPEGLRASAAISAALDAKDPLQKLEQAAQAETVWRALRQLPENQREILLLRHVECMDLDSVAQVVGCSRMSAPVRLFRARSKFKEIYLSLLQEERE